MTAGKSIPTSVDSVFSFGGAKFKSKQNQKMSPVKPKAEVISVWTDDEAELLLNATLKTKQQWACAFDL